MAELDSDKVGLLAPVETADIADNAVDDEKLRDSAGFSVIGKATTGTGNPADIVAGDEAVLGRTAAGNLAFAQVATGQVADGAIDDAKLRDSAALTVIGRAVNSSGDPADIAAGTDHYILRRSGTTLGFGDKEVVGFNTATAHTGTLTETIIRSISIAANRLGINGGFILYASGSIINGGAPAAKTIRVKVSTITLATVVRTGSNAQNWEFTMRFANRGNDAIQVVSGQESDDDSFTITASILSGHTMDTSGAIAVDLTGELADTGDTITSAYMSIEFFQVAAS